MQHGLYRRVKWRGDTLTGHGQESVVRRELRRDDVVREFDFIFDDSDDVYDEWEFMRPDDWRREWIRARIALGKSGILHREPLRVKLSEAA